MRELLRQIEALRARLEQRRGMRDDESAADHLAASLEGRLSDEEQRRIRKYFDAEPGAEEGDVEGLADFAALLRRVVDEDLGVPPPRIKPPARRWPDDPHG